MKIALTYSSKEGLQKEYSRRYRRQEENGDIPVDFFAEGDSPETIGAIRDSLRNFGHEVQGFEADDDVGPALTSYDPELVFNVAEGLFGDFRESYIPMVCEKLGLAYTGSDPLTLAVCLNKARTKEILTYHGIPNALFRVYYPGEPVNVNGFSFPAIVKPVAEGSSKGIFNDSVVKNVKEAEERITYKLARYEQPILIEQFLEGDEFTIAVWGNEKGLEVLPIVAIAYDELPDGAMPIYSYEAKWIWDTPEKPLRIFECPARIPPKLRVELEDLAMRTFRILGIRDWCRIDVRLDGRGVPHVLEVNPLPGILPNPEDNSCFPKAARTSGYGYAEMLGRVVSIASARLGLIHETVCEEIANTCRLQ
ncbi:MAG: D-alanine--D-alanine ligase [bacterium]